MALLGRPPKHSQKLFNEIAERLAKGEHQESICADPHMPDPSTIFRWEIAHPDFCKMLAQARRVGAHALIAKARDISDDGRNDWMERHARDGSCIGWQVNGEAIQRSKLRCEQLWKEAQAMSPREFGQKMQMEHSGGIAITEGDNTEAIMERITHLLTTGRVKLPGGMDIVEIDDPDEDDFSDLAAPQPEEDDDDDFSDIA